MGRSSYARTRALSPPGRYFLLTLVSPLIALSAATCADASSSQAPQDVVTASPEASIACVVDGECGSGMSCVDGQCVDACHAVESLEASIGCEFWAPTPDSAWGTGSCFAAYVVNASKDPISIEVTFAGEKLDTRGKIYVPHGRGASLTYEPLTDGLAPNDLAVIFLNEDSSWPDEFHTRCPGQTKPLLHDVRSAVEKTGRGHAFSLTTSGPATAYTIYPYGGAPTHFPTATMLLPATSFGTEHIAVDPWVVRRSGDDRRSAVVPTLQLVGTEDDTKVTITPVTSIDGTGDVVGATARTPQTWTLGKGELLQLFAPTFMGAPVVADKPIGLFSSARAMQILTEAADTAQQQIPPVRGWGRELAAVSYRSRLPDGAPESVPWRIMAAVEGTELTYEPERPENAPSVLGKGEHALFWTTTEFVVRSQDDGHPIYLSGHMTGGENIERGMGDAEFVNVVPTAQFLKRTVFLTDPTYNETSLVLVRARTEGEFRDVVLDCAGTIEGWKWLGKDLEFTRVDVMREGVPQKYANRAGVCDHGRHEMLSEGPFGVTVWGWDSYASYAFTGGSGTREINQVVVR